MARQKASSEDMKVKRREDDGNYGPGGVQSVETGIELLVALARLSAESPLQMLKTIAQAAGIPASKAHRYLVSFKRTGMVEQDADNGRYRLGPNARLIGVAAISGAQVIHAASQRLPNLSKVTGFSSTLAIWTQSGPTVVWVEDATRPITVTTRVGEILPLYTSAIGRVFSAWMPEASIQPLLQKELILRYGIGARGLKTKQAELNKWREEIRQLGLGWTVGEVNKETSALAAPIFDYRGDLPGVIAIFGASKYFDIDPGGRLAIEIRSVAEEISEELGYLKKHEDDCD
ncbi:IclR family transcriptional regulator [Candidatus Nitrotoga sp. M5]|uniref:IclR family transcriptional regulator n=1 Tax=Candidatus Nitrotoga sp. M5 TaxID=2890409 RepID=UPI001EF4EE23|nr:IclR family transcriptional regulator [Candidatus Nitrotoga sp. M5]CAH1387514.1 Transcriptional regulator, IclR family [Candidatus Nitrotoga sp. M5]